MFSPQGIPTIVLEGDYSTWTLVLDKTIEGTRGYGGEGIRVSNNGSVIARDRNPKSFLVKLDGTVVFVYSSGSTALLTPSIDSSATGKYMVTVDTTNNYFRIYKDGQLIQSIKIDLVNKWVYAHQICIGISPNGKYIAVVGVDVSYETDRIQIYEGS